MEQFGSVTLNLIQGFKATFEIFFVTLALALPLGLLIMLGCRSRFKPVKWLFSGFVWIIRGTPLMLQLFVVFYGPGLIWGSSVLDRFWSVIVAFVINYAAYFSVIYRGGIDAIPKGQYEAGQVLGMNRRDIFFKVVLLQVIKRIIAPMSNEIITLVKDTSLARVISVAELIMMAEHYSKTEGLLWPLFYTAVFYLLFCGLLTILLYWLEKKLDYFKC